MFKKILLLPLFFSPLIIFAEMADKIQDDNEKLHTFLSDEKNVLEEMLQSGLDKANQAVDDANNKLDNEISKVNNKLQTGMDEVYDVLTEQKNDQEKMLGDLTGKVQEGLKILEDSIDENKDQLRSEISLLQIEVSISN